MDFEFSAEQVQLRKLVRDFAEKEIGPHVLEWDETQTFPLDVIKTAGEMGLSRRDLSRRSWRFRLRLHRVLHHH